MYKEKNLTADFSKWLRKSATVTNDLRKTWAIEFKCKAKGKRLHLSRDFQPQQLPELYRAYSSCLYHKISDMGIGVKPFDSVQICHSPAYVGIMWYEPRKKKTLYLIHIARIRKHMEDGLISIAEHEATNMASHIIYLI